MMNISATQTNQTMKKNIINNYSDFETTKKKHTRLKYFGIFKISKSENKWQPEGWSKFVQ